MNGNGSGDIFRKYKKTKDIDIRWKITLSDNTFS